MTVCARNTADLVFSVEVLDGTEDLDGQVVHTGETGGVNRMNQRSRGGNI